MDEVECQKGEEENVSGNCVEPIDNCEPGYTLQNPGELYCKSCKPGFENNQTTCDEFEDPRHCDQVEFATPKICLVCEEGYDFVKGSGEDCFLVPDNCAQHNVKDECDFCEDGWSVDKKGECDHRDALPGCVEMKWGQSASDDACSTCEDGFLVTEGSCTAKTRDVDANCEEADEWGWCRECTEPMQVTSDGGCMEEKAGPENCEEHTDGVCSSCKDG